MSSNLLTKKEISQLSKLAAESFSNDPYYIPLDENPKERKNKIEQLFEKSTQICNEYGQVYMIKQNENIIGFSLWFDYHELKQNSSEDFSHIFSVNQPENYFDRIAYYANQTPKLFYLLAIAVNKKNRNMGWASSMIYEMQKTFPDYVLFSDLSNKDSIGIYEVLDFEVVEEIGNTRLVSYHPDSNSSED